MFKIKHASNDIKNDISQNDEYRYELKDCIQQYI